ncbi:hypothetical protein P43SY_000421 [Pythium insidiosum]|uniref:Uncharacterized protein n=1 Tax=Pythium insidiosum TaxID=114742 RepID=A0AAD5QA52_PYTIN|nr:hypothetical protein P43SY_000421 [Pythium insidiosum]
MRIEDVLRVLHQSNRNDAAKKAEQLAAVQAYVSQPHVVEQILADEAELAEHERLHPDDEFWDVLLSWWAGGSDIFTSAVAQDVDILSLFFSPPWVDRIPNTLRHFQSGMIEEAARRPHGLEVVETILNSPPFRAGDMERQFAKLRRSAECANDADLLKLLLAHGMEYDMDGVERVQGDREQQQTRETEDAPTSQLFGDDGSDY